ncbi:hypothetical protein ACHAXA_003997 [Cyclostephanos tholiformis]|uniref:SD-repeat containing protein B domain-containing protein n=1 Tax=Cyclostephanos tholiformis TaxID=382380 RepID=A0ABD3R9E0_9STRA
MAGAAAWGGLGKRTGTTSSRHRRRPRPSFPSMPSPAPLALLLLGAWRDAAASSSRSSPASLLSSTSSSRSWTASVPVQRPRRVSNTAPTPTPTPTSAPSSPPSTNHTKNECKMDHNALYPGSSLTRGQFLCYGDLRFGIDASNGNFVLGFVDLAPEDEDGSDFGGGGDESSSSAPDRITPRLSAWLAVPTSLFASPDAQFERVDLSPGGNLLGYDSYGVEIYDSNYDYEGRVEGESSSSNSILYFSQLCWDVNWIGADGEDCAKLTSPSYSGLPQGTVTWRIRVLPEDIREKTTSPSISPSLSSSLSPTISSSPSSPSAVSSPPVQDDILGWPTPVPSPSGSPVVAAKDEDGETETEASIISTPIPPSLAPTLQNLFLEEQGVAENDPVEADDEYDEYGDSIPVATIWGIVWLDSNRNGAMDLGEERVDDFKVKLYPCRDNDGDDDGEISPGRRMSISRRVSSEDSGVTYTGLNGTYFFEKPVGETYLVKFEVDPEVYGFSSGIDTSTKNMWGYTVCSTLRLDGHIQWNAGLYLIDDSEYEAKVPEMDAAVSPTANVNASIGGFIYLDVDENGVMDSNERTAAVGGYTVNDASILVSLTDCNTNRVVKTLDKSFPGTYTFQDLPEGFYKLRYDMQVVDGLNSTDVPLYSFIDSIESTFYETKCGKLGNGETNDWGNVGLRVEPLDMSAYSAAPYESIFGNNTIEDASQRAVATVSEGSESQAGSGRSSFVPGMVGFIVAMSLIGVVAIIVSTRKNQVLLPFSFLGSNMNDREGSRSPGSSRVRDLSLVSADLHSQKNDAGSETGKSAAAYSNLGDNDSDGSDAEKESFTGLQVPVKNGWVRENPSEIVIGEINEAGSEGYEVYDDEEGSEQSAVDYGPVVSNIIAKYSEKLGQSEIHQDEELGIYAINNSTFRNYHDETDSTQSYYTGSSRSSDPPAASYKDISAANFGWRRDDQHAEMKDDQHSEILHQYDSYHQAPINDVGFDVLFGPNQYVSIIDREHNAYPHDDSESSSSDSDSGSDFSEEAINPGCADSSHTNKSCPVRVPPVPNVDLSESRTHMSKSNPRDCRRSVKHHGPIPENSTMEYSPPTSSIQPISHYDDNNGNGVISAADKVEDNKSVVSTGSDQSFDPPGASYKSIHNFPPQSLPRKTTPPPPRWSTPKSPNPRRSTSAPRAAVRGFPSPSPPRR